MSYFDKDGLLRKFGTEKTVPAIGGSYKTFGDLNEIELNIDLTKLTTSAAIVADAIFFPKGARIEEVEVVTLTAADSAADTAVLNVGLIATDRSTTIDADGFLSGVVQTSMDAAGEKNVYRVGVTHVGSSVGTTTTSVGYITADWDTEAFTAGVILVRIRFMVP